MTVQDTAQADVAPLSTSSSPDELEAVMDAARAGAESQRELEEQGIDPLGPTDADDRDQVDDDEDLDDDEPETEQPRRDQPTVDVPVPTAQDSKLVSEIIAACGSEDRFAALKQKVVAGKATPAEQAEAKTMAEWRQVVGPLWRVLVAEGARLGQAQRPTAPTKARPAATSSTSKPSSAAPARPKAPASAPAKKPAAAATSPKLPKLPPMLLATGELNPDFERLAHSGALYGREKLTED